ncbi:substrate-binding periplasmic protein [Crenobacter intestini]|uniref:Transporter substrate-binding domain-containing protein n=1 Tax=Crenobacter intestini TaxID=2563443 RepID=A0A4T0UPA8_9NEIS|nr:transporter substrate-binding domain-containing protein [Crenobacter intestini]TIC80598.1 transporter substrate-binding domain-containing protein [Crenobacter intestini]
MTCAGKWTNKTGLPGLLGGLLACLPLLAEARPPVVLMTQQQSPYVEVNADGVPASGLALERVRCAFRRLGVPLEVRLTAWARSQAMVEHGQADGFFPASANAERDRWATLSATVAPQEWRWYLPAGSLLDPGSAEFRQHARVTAYHGSNMARWLQDNGYQLLADPPTHDELLGLLLRKRVDAVLGSQLAMDVQVRAAGAERRVRSVLLLSRPLGVYFGHRFLAGESPDFLQRFNTQLAACQRGQP